MTATAYSGPLVVFGRSVTASSESNPDLGPSAFSVGSAILDPRSGWRRNAPAGSAGAFCFYHGGEVLVIDQVPSALGTATLAALANAATGVPMTLAGAAGGITVLANAMTIPQTGAVVPAGALVIDGAPAVIGFGQNGTVSAADPRTAVARAVSITGVASGTGGNFLVKGADLYGMPQTETIAATAGATTTNGKKGWKFITAVIPQFTDAHTYSVGTTDIYEVPLRADEFGALSLVWNGTLAVSGTFVVADTTSPATATTGSVRGTILAPSASDGTKRMQLYVSVAPWNAATSVGLLGVTPA